MYIIVTTFNMYVHTYVFCKTKIVLIVLCMYIHMYICAYCCTCICMNNVYLIKCSYVCIYIKLNICLTKIRVVTDRPHLFGVWSASMLLKCINKQSNKLMCVCTYVRLQKTRRNENHRCIFAGMNVCRLYVHVYIPRV